MWFDLNKYVWSIEYFLANVAMALVESGCFVIQRSAVQITEPATCAYRDWNKTTNAIAAFAAVFTTKSGV